MKILITKKEYRQLLDLVFLGDWVASLGCEDDGSPYEALREKIYSYAKDYGFETLIEYDKVDNKHYETAAFEDGGAMEYIEAYDEWVEQGKPGL